MSMIFFGVDVLDLDFWVQINSIEQPVKSNSVGSGNVSHDRNFIVLKNIQLNFLTRWLDIWRNNINVITSIFL